MLDEMMVREDEKEVQIIFSDKDLFTILNVIIIVLFSFLKLIMMKATNEIKEMVYFDYYLW